MLDEMLAFTVREYKQSVSRPDRLSVGGKGLLYSWARSFMSPDVCVGAVQKKTSCSCRLSNSYSSAIQLVG